jgi:hypothetical protein
MISLSHPWLLWQNAVADGIAVLLLHYFLPSPQEPPQLEEDED